MAQTQREKAVVDLVINGQQSKATLKEIAGAAVNARKELNRMVEADNPAAYARKLAEVKKLNAAQRDMSARINDTSTSWGKFMKSYGTLIPGVAGGNLLATGVEALISAIPMAIDKSVMLKDELADIAKAADLTDTEVADLNKQLGAMDTRTPTKELRAIAEVGGQFGVAKKDLVAFTDGMNQLNVAIGKDFGGVENLSKDMTAVRNIFTNIKSDKIDVDLLRIGNAFNVLEASGAATAPVIADFSSRMGGTLIPLGLSEDQILGYSATLQELNVTAERGSTAVVDIFQKMLTETETFAKVAGMDVKEYKKLISTDMNAAFLAYLKGLKNVQGNQVEFAKVLEKSKLTGSGVMEVLSKLSVNSEMLAEKTDMAGKALKNTDSITAEYSKKNFDLAVNLKKISEWFDNFMTSPTVMKFAEWVTGATVKLLGMSNASKEVSDKWKDQKARADELQKNLDPLLTKYDKLKQKSILTRTEQEEMRKIIDQVTKAVPQAATQFDAYGKAMDISTGKAREAIESQKALARYMNQTAIEETGQERTRLLRERARLQLELNQGTVSSVGSGGQIITRKMLDDEIRERQARMAEINDQLNENNQIRRGLGADTIEDRRANRRGEKKSEQNEDLEPLPKKAPGAGGTGTVKGLADKDKNAEKAENKAQTAAEQLEQKLTEVRQRSAKNAEEDYEAALIQFGDRYADMINLANKIPKDKVKGKLAEIGVLMDAELKTITDKYDKKERERQEKLMKEQIGNEQEQLEAERRIRDSYISDRLTAEGIKGEQAQVLQLESEEQYLTAKLILWQSYYDKLAGLNEGDSEKSAEIAKEKKATIAGIEGELTQVLSEQYAARRDQQRADNEYSLEQSRQRSQWLQEELQFRRQIIGELSGLLMNSWSETLTNYRKFWKETTAIQKVAFMAQRAFALAEIAINLSRQISAINLMAAGIDILAPGAGTLIKLKSIGVAVLMAGIQTAKILATSPSIPSFEDGGYTNPAGYTSGEKIYRSGGRKFRAGERGTEFIMSNPMLQNQVMADLAGILNTLQVTGAYKQLSYGSMGGGNTTNVSVDQMLVVAELQSLGKRVDRLADRPMSWNYLALEKVRERVDYINDSTTI